MLSATNASQYQAQTKTTELQSLAQIPEQYLSRLLDLLELAARRGAFEIEEYQAIGEIYNAARAYL